MKSLAKIIEERKEIKKTILPAIYSYKEKRDKVFEEINKEELRDKLRKIKESSINKIDELKRQAIANLTKLGPRAFTYGVLFAISQSFGSLFPFISGALADVFGLQIIYTIVSILSFTAVFVTYLMLKR